jgi:predicted dehydrogenase/sugar phosphate isomerase/epimerase
MKNNFTGDSLNQFGISTLLFREVPLPKAIDRISHTPLKSIDLAIVPPKFCPHYDPINTNEDDDKKLRELIDHSGLRVVSLNIVPGYFNADEPTEVSRFIRRSVSIAQTLGGNSISLPSGKKADQDWEGNVRRVAGYLKEEAKYAGDHGIVLSLETPHVRTLTETLREVELFYEILDSEAVRCTFDTSHILRGEKNSLVDGLKAIGLKRISQFHLRDAMGEEISYTPGKGNGDFPEFFRRVKDAGFRGNFIFELEFDDYSEKQKFAELDFALRYCLSLYLYDTVPWRLGVQTHSLFQLFSRFKHNPVKEIKRHEKIFQALRKLKPAVRKLSREKVYQGRWVSRYRFRKNRVVTAKPNSIVVVKNPETILRIGIVGCGWAGQEMHGPGFERLNNTRIVGVYDIDESKTNQCARRFNCQGYSFLETLVRDAQPDIVAVCSREWAHHEAVMYLLCHGVDVFCEKIMATRYQDAVEMVHQAKRENRVLAINYNYRFMPGIRKIREVIEQKALGELVFFNINVHAMSYHHALDLLSFLGGRIVTVSATFNNDDRVRPFGNTDWSKYDPDILYVPSINASVTCEFESGAVGVVNSSYYYNLHSFVLAIEAVFEEGCVTLNGINMFDTTGGLSFRSNRKIHKVSLNHKAGVYARGYEYTFYSSIESFIRNYLDGIPSETTGEQGLLNILLEKAISRSHRDKVKVDFSRFIVEQTG